jgi:stress-induced morphogen
VAITIPRGKTDPVLERIVDALRSYESDHPEARIDLYRQNVVSVRVRIIDPSFAGSSRVERHRTVWRYLDALDEDVQSDISTLILLAPGETKSSFANMEFEDPVPSGL